MKIPYYRQISFFSKIFRLLIFQLKFIGKNRRQFLKLMLLKQKQRKNISNKNYILYKMQNFVL